MDPKKYEKNNVFNSFTMFVIYSFDVLILFFGEFDVLIYHLQHSCCNVLKDEYIITGNPAQENKIKMNLASCQAVLLQAQPHPGHIKHKQKQNTECYKYTDRKSSQHGSFRKLYTATRVQKLRMITQHCQKEEKVSSTSMDLVAEHL